MPDQYFFPPGMTPGPKLVAATTIPVRLLRANPRRTVCTIENKSTGTLFLKFGPAATLSDYNLPMAPNSFFESPTPKIAQREFSGVWDKFTAGDVAAIDEDLE